MADRAAARPDGIELDVTPARRRQLLVVSGILGVMTFSASAAFGVGAVAAARSRGALSEATPILAVAAVIFTGLLGIAVFLGLTPLRYSARLDGTILVIQGAFRTGRVDLATAPQVWTQATAASRTPSTGAAAPMLLARGEDGTRVAVPLRIPQRTWLPPAQLIALADAIGDRPEARSVIDELRGLAADPDRP